VIAYLDSSVILRIVFDERDSLAEWSAIDQAVTSVLARVECLRVLDRERLRLGLPDDEIVRRAEAVAAVMAGSTILDMSPPILERAAQPFPTTLGTLDALHLASALLYRQSEAPALVLATHDLDLGRAGRASGLPVLGC
jgi:predicted nucleic acid-binding protein